MAGRSQSHAKMHAATHTGQILFLFPAHLPIVLALAPSLNVAATADPAVGQNGCSHPEQVRHCPSARPRPRPAPSPPRPGPSPPPHPFPSPCAAIIWSTNAISPHGEHELLRPHRRHPRSLGVAARRKRTAQDPGADFTLLENGCVIKGVDHETTDKTDDNGRNEDTTRCAQPVHVAVRGTSPARAGRVRFRWVSAPQRRQSLAVRRQGDNSSGSCKRRMGYPTSTTSQVNETVGAGSRAPTYSDTSQLGLRLHAVVNCVKLDDPKEDKEDNIAGREGRSAGGSAMPG